MHVLRMSWKCSALLEAAAVLVLLLLSLRGRGAGTEAPAEREEPAHAAGSPALPRESV